MGCEQCKLLVHSASDSESTPPAADNNVIANITAEHPQQLATTSADNANQLSHSSLIELKPLASSDCTTSEMDQQQQPLDDEVPATAAASLIDLRDIDSNILDSTERLEVADEVADLADGEAPPQEEEGGEDDEGTPVPPTEGEVEGPDNNESVEEPTTPTSAPSARKKRGTVRVNSMRGHRKVGKLYCLRQAVTCHTGRREEGRG